MLRNGVLLPFRILGIPIRLDGTFLLVLPLFGWMIGAQIPLFLATFQRLGPGGTPTGFQSGPAAFLLGFVAAVGLFASVLVHELGHAVAARRYGIEVKEIRLWFLGGIATFDELPRQRGAEAVVAIIGPIVSGLLFLLFRIAATASEGVTALFFLTGYLALINGWLALFNLLPALPLDGGRVLRSLLALRLTQLRATRIAGGVSRVLAIGLGVVGVAQLNLFLVAIAFFLYHSVGQETRYAVIVDLLEGLTVADLMTRDVLSVDPDMPIGQFRQLMYYRRHLGYPVVGPDDVVAGFAVIADARDVDDDARVGSIMMEADTVPPETPALEVLQRVGSDGLGRLVVTGADGTLLGIVSRSDLLRTLQLRAGSQERAAR